MRPKIANLFRISTTTDVTVIPHLDISASSMTVPSYITIPSCAVPLDGSVGGGSTSSGSNLQRAPSVQQKHAFPPAAAAAAAAAASPSNARRFVPSTSSLSTNVSDLVLSSLLPPNLPRQGAPTPHTPGRARELTSQREGLGLNGMSQNFRRFVTKVSGCGKNWE